MKNKNIELLIKLNEKYGLNDEIVFLKQQLKKSVAKNRELQEQLIESQDVDVFFLKRWFLVFWEALKEFFRKKDDIIKDLRKFYSKQYKYAHEQFELGFLDERELNILIENDVNPGYRIWQLQKELDEKQKKEHYLAVVQNNKSRLIEFLNAAKADKIVLNEELRRVNKLKFYSADDLRGKNNKINRLTGRIKKLDKEIESIQKAIEDAKQKVKRPVGRPKGSTKKTKDKK